MRTGKKKRADRKKKALNNHQKYQQISVSSYRLKAYISTLLSKVFRYVGLPVTVFLLVVLKAIYILFKKPKQISAIIVRFSQNLIKKLPKTSSLIQSQSKSIVSLFQQFKTDFINGFNQALYQKPSILPQIQASNYLDTAFVERIWKTKNRQRYIQLAIQAIKRKPLKNSIIYRQAFSRLSASKYKLNSFFRLKVSELKKFLAQKLPTWHKLAWAIGQKWFILGKTYTVLGLVSCTQLLRKISTQMNQYFGRGWLLLISAAKTSRHNIVLGSKTWRHQISNSSLVQFLIRFNRQLHLTLTKTITIKFRYVFVMLLLCGFGIGSGYFYYSIIRDLPDASQLGAIRPELTTKIYDRHGILLYKIYKDENRSLVPLIEIPKHMIQATVAIEDQNFFQHPGFSVRGITRAFKSNLTNESLQGGSTITQQLIKNTLLTPERTFERKAKELILSFITEFYYTKDQILAMYLNQVPYGGSAYGVEEAAQMYFGKSIRQVSLAEASFLAGLPAAPTKFSPYGPHPETARSRQQQVLRRMVEDGYITNQEAEQALSQELAILPPKASLLAPHFVMYVRDVLADLYGPQMVDIGGLEVTTSLDLGLQQKAQEVVSAEVSNLSSLRVSNGAALVTNPGTGEILAMVGSIDYFDSANDGQVNVTIRERQPGSSIKPLMYSMALERGLSPATIIPDSPICYNIKGQPPYCPKNYDGNYHGKVSLRQALANSYNVPAVKTLAQFSVNDLIDHAEKLGITTWGERNRFGLALTLGGGEIKMTDMAVAYGVFANQGKRVDLTPILEVKNAEGKVIDQRPCINPQGCVNRQVLDPRVAYQISDILSDNQARSQAFGLNSVLHIPNQQVAVKTGTTNSLRDNWTIGYTNDRLVAVWVGNNDNTPMSYIASGITGASPIWNKLTIAMLNPDNPNTFEIPNNLAKVKICTITGELACNGCPSREEYFIAGTEPKSHCSSDAIANILNPKSPEAND